MNEFKEKCVAAAQPCVAGKLSIGKFSHISKKASFGCFVGFVTMVFLLTGCRTDLKLAKTFVSEHTGIQAAVYFPEKAEVKSEYNPTYGRCDILKGFSQDLFLDVMYNVYAEAMDAYGVTVYIPEDIENVQVDSLHWLVMLSRVEVTESITEYEDYLFSDTDEYSYKHPLNMVNVASWFEVNDGDWKPVLYCEHNLVDGFDSKTDYSFWSGKLDYTYAIDTLELNDVYNYAVYLGKLYAGYTYDYMMNDFVDTELKKQNLNYWDRFKLRYDPYRKELRYSVDGDGFMEIKE